jgi:hypothetical protein
LEPLEPPDFVSEVDELEDDDEEDSPDFDEDPLEAVSADEVDFGRLSVL